jgi:polysaccharide chain length determinant protein (PEP-CTERM system associated)
VGLEAGAVNPFVNEVLDQVRGSWRFRWYALAAAAAVALAGWVVIFLLEDRYEAGASIFVDTRTPLKPALQGLTPEQDIDAELNFVRQSLLADPSLKKIASENGLLPANSTNFQQQAVLTGLRQRIDISVNSASGRPEDLNTAGSIYHIAYQDRDRARSLRIVGVLLDTLVNETLGGKREGSQNAQQFLESQIADYEKRLRTAEDRLAAFKSKHLGLMPSEQGGYFAELQKESDAVASVKTKLAEAEARRATLTRQLHGDVAAAAVGSNGQTGTTGSKGGLDTQSRIDEAQARLDELLLKYTDAHPDVIATRQTLEALKQRRAEELQGLRNGDPAAASRSGASSNPVYQSVQLALNQVEVDITDLNTELAQHQAKVSELRGNLTTAPQVEAEYAQINRDYESNKAQYTALLASLQKTRLGERAVSAGSVRFEIVQPPTAPYSPAWPRRKLFMSLILLAAIALGAALAFGLNYLLPVVDSAGSIARVIGVPVLGEVTAAFPERERLAFRQDLLRLSVAATCLIVAFAVALVLSQSGYRVSMAALKHLVNA